MADPPEKNVPFSRAKDGAVDVGDTVDFILDRTGADKVDLVAWSWGTVIAGMYAAGHGDKVGKLVLYAPIYGQENPDGAAWLADPDNPDQLKSLGAYRTADAVQTQERWASQIVPEDKSQWREEGFPGVVRSVACHRAGGRCGLAGAERGARRPVGDLSRPAALRRRPDRGANAGHSR